MSTTSAAEMDKTEVVMHILRHKKNYFNLLQVSKTSTKAEVTTAYKKLALKCHPDKNEHPQAAEAFKLLGSARDVLSDPEKRQSYVRRGDEGVRQHESGMQARQANRGSRQVDPFEEFFTFFSSGGFFQQENSRPNTRRYYDTNTGGGGAWRGPQNQGARTTRDGRQPRNDSQHPGSSFFMFLPFVMFLVMVMVLQSSWESMNPGSYEQGRSSRPMERVFSLTPMPDKGLVVRQTTSLFNTAVDFYTNHKNIQEMQKSRDKRLRVEREVLKEKKNSLNRRCEADTFNNRARGSKDLPESCEEFRKLNQALG